VPTHATFSESSELTCLPGKVPLFDDRDDVFEIAGIDVVEAVQFVAVDVKGQPGMALLIIETYTV
jgi:hypothetical protein